MKNELRVAIDAAGKDLRPEIDGAIERLVARAEESDLVDVVYALVESPFGPMFAASTRRGLVMLSYGGENPESHVERVARLLSSRVMEAPRRMDEVRRQLDEYFDGSRKRFDLVIDWSLTKGFTRRVLRATARIPFGGLSTYREVARRAGNERAVRAAGNALGSNPIPVVVPCHRVVRTGGALGGYTGGLDRKRWLLQLEGALPTNPER